MSAGASAIWLLTPTLNLMLETVWDRTSTPAAVLEVGQRASQDNFVIVPGLRAAINLPRDLQIVPGFGMPLGVGPSSGARDFFLYLSFEHPFH